MATVQSILEWVVRAKKEGDAAKQTQEEIKNVGKAAKETGGFAKFLGDNFMITGGELLGFAKAIPAATVELVDQGLEIKRAKVALEAYAGSSAEAEAAIAAVTEATGGAISKFGATQTATKLFSMGLADSASQAGKLAEMAVTLGAAVGEDAGSAIENFSLMLANQSIPRLDTFGLSGAAVRERMNELQAATEGLDRQTAFLTATMELGQAKLDDLAASGFNAVSSVDRLRAEMQNAKDALATTVADGLVPIIDGFYLLKDAIGEQEKSAIHNTTTYEDYLEKLEQLKQDHPILFAGTEELTRAQWAQARASEALDEDTLALANSASDADLVLANYASSSDIAAGSLDGLSESTDGATSANDRLAISLNKVTEATLAREALDALKQSLDDGTLSAENYEIMARNVLITLGGFTATEADASVALTNLQQMYQDGEISALEYYQAVNKLSDEVKGIPKNVDVDINIRTHGSVPNLPSGNRPGYSRPVQSGASWLVSGPPGIDAIPVSFMATRGERVTVTPQGVAGGPGGGPSLTINAQGAQFYGVGGIRSFADELLPYLRQAERNY